jgi:hypothetical protein
MGAGVGTAAVILDLDHHLQAEEATSREVVQEKVTS